MAHHRNHRWPGHFDLADILIAHEVFQRFIGHLVFKGDDLSVSPELRGHVFYQLGIKRLIDGDKNAPHEQRSNKILAAYSELFRKILHADAFCHRDGTGDGHRLLRNLSTAETRRWGKALHGAFLGLRILLASAPLLRSRPLRPGRFPWRGHQPGCTSSTRPSGTEARPSAKARPSGAKARPSTGPGWSTRLGPRWVHGPARTHGSVLGRPGAES